MKLMKLKKDMRAVTSTALIVLIAILVVSASTVAVLLYTGTQQNQGPSNRAVMVGDTVKVNYIGRLDDGRVFDTSLWDVASNDALYPKSLSFTLRAQTAYKPLEFLVGSGQMISGFDSGVQGMVEGQTKVITVPPDEGYGEMNTSKLYIMALQVQVPILVEMNFTEFASIYGSVPTVHQLVSDPLYGWDVMVEVANTDSDVVVVMNKPIKGESYAVYGEPDASSPTGWWAQITMVDTEANGGDGAITVNNLLTDADARMVEGYDLTKGSTFIVDMVSEEEGTYRMNYNGELVGQTLYFTVTLVEIVNA